MVLKSNQRVAAKTSEQNKPKLREGTKPVVQKVNPENVTPSEVTGVTTRSGRIVKAPKSQDFVHFLKNYIE